MKPLFAIRNTKTDRLLTMFAATDVSGFEDGIHVDRRDMQVEGAMAVLDYEGRNPIFVCDDRELVENLLRTGCADEFMNHIILNPQFGVDHDNLELVELSVSVVSATHIPREVRITGRSDADRSLPP
jgi:hypothetical protein